MAAGSRSAEVRALLTTCGAGTMQRPSGWTVSHGQPRTRRTKLAKEQPFKFERWGRDTRVPRLVPNDQQVGGGGIDGVGYLLAKPETSATDQVLAQVKGGKYQLGQLRYGTSRKAENGNTPPPLRMRNSDVADELLRLRRAGLVPQVHVR